MIIEEKSEIKVLKNFCNNPFEYFSILQMSKKVKISRNWMYKIMSKFEQFGILERSEKRYKLDFSHLFCKRLKLLFDAEYLSSLDENMKNSVFDIAHKIIFEINPQSVVLVGSVAFNEQKKESDIDFLVIAEKKEIPHFENCNIVLLSEKEFKEKYLKGDDFIISALSFGKILYDTNIFIKFFENPLPIFSQEIIQEKIKYCEKLEERIYTLLKTDQEKAQEELLYLALQTARIILLKNRVVPKTKYEIGEQVTPFDKKLAETIENLLKKKELTEEKMLEYVGLCIERI
ncbi:MAG: nucleotidyltransferase domain-containing protein [Methanomicrobia archaeon]|nr:nucleotidyltransferase domain-containing protein [Methanomicrobia archaeon]